jgi:hypothetical protein
MNKYKIYCSVDGWVEVIASSLPTQCPIDNAHSVTLESATILEEDIYINDGTLTDVTLDDYKTLRYHDVDTRTSELISQGFTYQAKVFSLSPNAQTNILALDNTRDDPALSYPIKYNTIDDLDSYDVIDATDLHNMYLTALATKKGHVDSGTVLKTSIRNAATKADVDAIIDNR